MSLNEEPEAPDWAKSARWIWHHLKREGSVIRDAPGAFILTALLIGVFEHWYLADGFESKYSGQIAGLQATIESDQAALKFQDERLAVVENRPSGQSLGPAQSNLRYVSRARTMMGGYYAWNTYYINRGAGPAIGSFHVAVGSITDKELSPEQIDKAFETLHATAKKAMPHNLTSQTQAGDPFFYTSIALVPSKFDGKQFGKAYALKPVDFDNQIQKNKKIIYWFDLLVTRDSDLPPGKFRMTEVCGYGVANSADHFCATHNEITVSD